MVSIQRNIDVIPNELKSFSVEYLTNTRLKTVEDIYRFFKFFCEGGDKKTGREPPLKYVYCSRINTGLEYRPYDIIVVPRGRQSYNHYVVTATSVAHVRLNSTYDVWTIERFMHEGKLFNKLRQLTFFKYYLKYKFIKRWLANISLLKFLRNREKFGKRFFLSKRSFESTVRNVQQVTYNMRLVQCQGNIDGKLPLMAENPSMVRTLSKSRALRTLGASFRHLGISTKLSDTSTTSFYNRFLKNASLTETLRMVFFPEERPMWGYTCEEYTELQQTHFRKVMNQLEGYAQALHAKIVNVCKNISENARCIRDLQTIEDLEEFLMQGSKITGLKIGPIVKQTIEAEKHERKRNMKKILVEYDLLQPLIRLGDYCVLMSLYSCVLATFEFFSRHLDLPSQNCSKDLKICFQLSVIFEGEEPIRFSPNIDELQTLLHNFVFTIVNQLNNIPRLPMSCELRDFMYREYSGDNLLSLLNVLENDKDFKTCLNRIQSVVNKDYADVAEKSKVYEPCRACMSFLQDEWPTEFKLWPERAMRKDVDKILSETEIRKYILKVNKHKTELGRLTNRTCGILIIYIDHLVQKYKQGLDTALDGIKSVLLSLCTKRIHEVGKELDADIQLLKKPQLDLHEFNDWIERCIRVENHTTQLLGQCRNVNSLFNLAKEYNFDFPQSLLDRRERTIGQERPGLDPLMSVFTTSLEDAKKFKVDNDDEMLNQLKSAINDTQIIFTNTTDSMEHGEFRDATNDPRSMLTQLQQIHANIVALEGQRDVLNGYCNNMGIDHPKWEEIHECKTVYGKRHLLLSTAVRWDEKRTFWNTTAVQQINGEDLKTEMIELFQFAHKINKADPDSVTKKLLAETTLEKVNMNVMVDLCNPAIKEEHWKQIFEAMGKRPIPIETRTLDTLRTLGAYEHQEAISHISGVASGEYVLVKQMEKITDLWTHQEFVLAKNRGQEDVKVLGGLEEITQMLEEQQIQVQTCLASRYIAGIKPLVEQWDIKLGIISDVLDEWVNVQKSWVYLEFVFSSDDIKKQLAEESKMFAMVNKIFRKLMKDTEAHNNVADICTQEGLLDRLRESATNLDKIQKRLEDYLETKRVAFPRFYFLSNDELLSILSDVRNPTAVQPHMQKCFDNIKELEFEGPIIITAMKSNEKEVVPFSEQIKAVGNVEHWLNDIERMMKVTLYELTKATVEAYPHKRRNDWYFDYPAQCIQCVDQIIWTAEVEEIWREIAAGNPKALEEYLQRYRKQILDTVSLVKGELNILQRTCVCTLIVVDVHNRDVVASLINENCTTVDDFNWQKQLRYYWMEGPDGMQSIDVFIHHGAAKFSYGYEYLGNQLRLVITPLTERAFFTCTSALHMFQGAAPQGPAGTGKTESVKDLGKALARQVVVFNCSDGINYRIMSRMFAGLAQAGAWACFDEFNRIEIEVLSVIAQQMLEITTAIANKQTNMMFDGHKIRLHKNFGVFITMNPGYAGRTELPDNLKALFRPICMMIPDYALIAEIMFFSEGFSDARNLSQKMVRLYSLASQQLSKQDHYDFGMRAVKSILVMAGSLKRAEPNNAEDMILIRAMRDSNVPKFLREDTTLFLALINDLFPQVEIKEVLCPELVTALEVTLERNKLQKVPLFQEKIMQLYETMVVRHGVMLVGQTMTGKTANANTLCSALTNLHEDQSVNAVTVNQERFYQKTAVVTLNPKSITMGEMYGDVNRMTREWQDGVLSNIVRELVKKTERDRYWINFDGPVDAVWIENMNTVLDDNKMLCLVNGERIKLPDTLSILFEVQDLRVASPATVSRCGMVYMDAYCLQGGWSPIATSQSICIDKELRQKIIRHTSIIPEDDELKKKAMMRRRSSFIVSPEEAMAVQAEEEADEIKEEMRNKRVVHWDHNRLMQHLQNFVPPTIKFLRQHCGEYIPSVDAQLVTNLIDLFKSSILTFLNEDDGDDIAAKAGRQVPSNNAEFDAHKAFDMLFLFAYVWCMGGNVNDAGRDKFCEFCREKMSIYLPLSMMPVSGSIFDYFVHKGSQSWQLWEYKVPQFQYTPDAPYFDLMVPTSDTVSLQQLLGSACFVKKHNLVTGVTGTGKSSAVMNFAVNSLQCENAESCYAAFSITFSAQTGSNNLQETIVSKLQKRRGDKVLGPPPGKKMVGIIDDCNMPQLEIYGASPPIELLRQTIGQGGFYDRKKLNFKEIVDVIFICCCGEPGGGKNPMSQRFTSRFLPLCITALGKPSMQTIFNGILGQFFAAHKFALEVCALCNNAVDATIEIYTRITKEMLPTPERTHYTFNLRDISKVIQGMLQSDSLDVKSAEDVVDLWCHESSRVFHDRLINVADKTWWWDSVAAVAKESFQIDIDIEDSKNYLYGSWADKQNDRYKKITDKEMLKSMLKDYQNDFATSSMKEDELVLFDDAMAHLARICRILRQPRGNALLVGVGGSGRHSLVELAAYICSMDCRGIVIVRNYGVNEFRDDVKKILLESGARNKTVVFLLADNQLIYSQMLEDVNNLLNIGEVPGMMGTEEFEVILSGCRDGVRAVGKPETRNSIYQYFVARCRDNMHIILCMSPVGAQFRDRLRMFPSLVNCMTIDWYTAWPRDALLSVASRFLRGTNLGSEELKEKICVMAVHMHLSVDEANALMMHELRRLNSTTPTSYLSLLGSYIQMYSQKLNELDGNMTRYKNGVEKLISTNKTVGELKQKINDMKPVLEKAAKEADAQKAQLAIDQAEAAKLKAEVSAEEDIARGLMEEAQGIKNECEAMLAKALPALEKAEEALNTLQAKDIQEIKVFTSPPANVGKTLDSVLILLGKKEGWQSAKLELSNIQFLKNLQAYDKDRISPVVIKKLQRFVKDPDFLPEIIEKTSFACKSLCMWALAMDKYYWVAKDVAPKKEMLNVAQGKVNAAKAELDIKQASVAKVVAKVCQLEEEARVTAERKAKLESQIIQAQEKLKRADQLLGGLASENERWQSNFVDLGKQRVNVIGTMCLAAGAVAYLGPFVAQYRQHLLDNWTKKCVELRIPVEGNFTLENLVGQYTIREWNLYGLPLDAFSIENGAILQWATRWCLMIDPQGQANHFIRKKEAKNKLKVIKLSDDNYMRVLESAVQVGLPVLLENVGEELDAALDPILLKRTVKIGGRTILKLGDKEVDYDPNFRIYITTKLPNPKFTPELQIKVNTVNFTVTRKGLEDQLLSDIVAFERADLQQKSDQCVVAIAKGKSEINGLEDTILRMLAESTGDILDSVDLISTLRESKKTADAIAKDLEVVEKTNVEIQTARERYRVLATRGSLIYKVVAELANIDPMYQYSLQFFKKLFISTLEKTKDDDPDAPSPEKELTPEENIAEEARIEARRKDPVIADKRVQLLISAVSWTSYSVICRGLFEKHKLLFSFMLTVTFKEHDGTFKLAEWDSFLKGGSGLKIPDSFPKKPNWLEAPAWLDACALCLHTPQFKDLEKYLTTESEWRQWIFSEKICDNPPPIPHSRANVWEKALLIKALRPEKLVQIISKVVAEYLGVDYTVSPQFSLTETFADSNCMSPLIFVLSAGTDPTALFIKFAGEMGYGDKKLMLSLGQDQGKRAEAMIAEGCKDGLWVYLQNCHVYVSWMPSLERIVEQMRPEEINPGFRLWLTSSPSKTFPVPVLQSGMKLTKEPPKGLKANMKDFFYSVEPAVWEEYTPNWVPPSAEGAEENADEEGQKSKYDDREKNDEKKEAAATKPVDPHALQREREWKRLMFTLAFVHALVQERRKFGALGWNIPYEWGIPDCQASIKTLRIAMENFDILPWSAIQYIIGIINYGGRVTDFLDQRCLIAIISRFFEPKLMKPGPMVFDTEQIYQFDSDNGTNSREDILDTIEKFPARESSELFGLHRNADISCQSKEAHLLISTLISVQPSGAEGGVAVGGKTEGEIIYDLCDDLLERLPKLVDREKGCEESFRMTEKDTMISLGTVLSQEIDQFNNLLLVSEQTLIELRKAIKGEVVMSAEMEAMFNSLQFNLIPENWKKAGYLCLKPLTSYYVDLISRVEFIANWCYNGFPRSYWVSGLFFPQGFATGIFQTHARCYNIPIDRIKLHFNPVVDIVRRLSTAATGNTAADNVTLPHIESGVFCHGFYLDGGAWEKNQLAESRPGILFDTLPPIHFQPVLIDAAEPPNIYECPLYKTSTRAGVLSTTGLSTNFVLSMQLVSPSTIKPEHWINRGLAALCMLDY